MHKTWARDLVLLSALISLLFGAYLGSYALNVPDEARYSEIPREMVTSHDYITPHLNGIVYFEKPILFYWLQSASIKIFGLQEWALRLPTALLAILGCLVVYSATRVIYDRATGLVASGILATSFLYLTMGHLITLDMAVTVFLTASLLSMLLALRSPKPTQKRWLTWLSAISAGFAVLTKGLIGVAFPGLIVLLWLLFCNEWRQLKHLPLFTSTGLLILITLPWHLLAEYANPGFLHFYFIEQHFLRYLTEYAGRYQPAWFFLSILPIAFFPWIAFLIQALSYQIRHKEREGLFLVLWAGSILIFYSLSQSKLIPYLLPVIPPLAILTARYLVDHLRIQPAMGLKLGFISLPGLALIISLFLLNLPRFHHVPNLVSADNSMHWLAAVLLTGTLSAYFNFKQQHFKSAITSLILMMSVFFWLFLQALPALDGRSIKPLAVSLKPLLKPEDKVVSYATYYQDLPVYLQRQVIIVDWCNELAFGMRYQDTSEWMLDQSAFLRLWQSSQRVFAIMSQERYHHLKTSVKLYPIAQTINNILVSNQK